MLPRQERAGDRGTVDGHLFSISWLRASETKDGLSRASIGRLASAHRLLFDHAT